MRIGVPKEIKNHEYHRVGLTPSASAAKLTAARGHAVFTVSGNHGG